MVSHTVLEDLTFQICLGVCAVYMARKGPSSGLLKPYQFHLQETGACTGSFRRRLPRIGLKKSKAKGFGVSGFRSLGLRV